MRAKISYLSLLRDVTQVKEEILELPDGSTIRDLIFHLLKKYDGLKQFFEQEENILITVNGEVISKMEMDKQIKDNSDIIIGLPPFGG
ncbi:MAG: MoaD/ThiS family protein [Candidatus Methanomethyliaceae archaeon]|nr:MoaD/ThiS family protein [Candidatus Methanomethyliaceae archaeon]MCX8170204.1 MoaD/ThiS family protein [Candidatus Methanomethyliaceae archaeon]MDW7970595.1 MoaD/ThiS family protein [Nitrososphaerota archaeon]